MEFFFHSEDLGPKERRACVAAKVDEENNLVFGIAVCSKGDQYSRKLGRAIAMGRIAKSRLVTKIPIHNRDVRKLFSRHAAAIARERLAKINAR